MKKRILHVVNIYFAVPYFLGEQLTYFTNKGYDEHIVCSPAKELGPLSQKLKFSFIEIPIKRKLSIISDIYAIIQISKYIRSQKIDIVVGHTPKGALLAMIAGFVNNTDKRIFVRHGLVFETSRGLKRKLLITIDKITALFSTKIINVSPSINKISERLNLNPPSKQLILSKGTYNGISIDKFCRHHLSADKQKEFQETLGITDRDFVIGFTGRITKDKGIIELIEAFRILRTKSNSIKLLLVGMFDERDSIPAAVMKEIIESESIVYTGYVDYNFIEYYYSLMDLFILPSYREGFPTSVLEASSMELPIVTTKATGCIDSIIENETGIFTSLIPSEIASKISYYMAHEDERIRHGKNGRDFVSKNFNSILIWEELEKLYR